MTLYQPDIRSPRASIFFAGLEREFGNLVFQANVSSSVTSGLITTDVVNRSYSRPGISDPFASRFQPALQQIYYRANQGKSNYNGISVSANYQDGTHNGRCHIR